MNQSFSLMNKSVFNAIIVIMCSALLGLIALQAYWINHDFQLKEQQFDQMVSSAMNQTVEKIDYAETYKLMSEVGLIKEDTIDLFHDTAIVNEIGIDDDLEFYEQQGTDYGKSKLSSGTGKQLVMEEIKDGKRIKRIIQEYDSTTFWPALSLRVNDKRIQSITHTEPVKSSSSVEDEYKFQMRDKIDKVSKVLIEMNRKFGQDTLAIWQRIDTNKLQQTLAADFIENGIDLQFNYGVVNEDSNTITYSKSKKEITELQNSKYRVHLFPNKLFASPEMLVVNFHGKLNYIFATLWPLVLCSFVLTLIVILGIFYTIHTIIRQKKLADIKNDFINNMTHEFKTPIATIGIATDTLKNPRVYSDHEKMSFYTDIIKQENERMNKQVSKVLQMAQIDKGEVKYSYETVNVHDLLEHIVQSVQLQVEQKEGKITYINEAKNYFLSADITHFGNTLNNLIDNAIKYAPVKPDIKIKMWNTGDSLLISIKDNGMGMNSDIQKRIFDKFYRATTGNLHDVKGFGLGLSYAKAIVDDMSGFINVESAPDKGSTFTVILPLSANNVSEEKNITNETLVS